MLPNPLFDHGSDPLHRAGYVDFSFIVARRRKFLAQFCAKAMVRQTYNARSMDRAIEMAREPCNQRVSHSPAAEKGDWDAPQVILVDKNADVSTPLQRLGD